MPLTAKKVSDVLSRARSHLNDPAGTLWTDQRLLPKVQDAYAWLYGQISVHTNSLFRKVQGSPYGTDITVPASTTNITSLLPADFYLPEKLEYRSASSGDWVEVDRVDDLPSQEGPAPSVFTNWCWKNQQLYVNAASAILLVRVHYLSFFSNGTDLDMDTSLQINNAVECLAYAAAANAYASRGQGPQSALMWGSEAEKTGALGFLGIILNQLVLNSQLVARRGLAYSGDPGAPHSGG